MPTCNGLRYWGDTPWARMCGFSSAHLRVHHAAKALHTHPRKLQVCKTHHLGFTIAC